MGKFRAHQDKSRRGRGNPRLKKKEGGAAGSVGGANGYGRRDEQHKRHDDVSETTTATGAAGAAGAGSTGKKKTKRTTYGKEHSVLICGDGDFSFTRGVIRHRGTGVGVVATSLDSRETVLAKYPRAKSWLLKLDEDGAQVVHGVDATRLGETLTGASEGEDHDAEMTRSETRGKPAGDKRRSQKKRALFDRVVFNFPHTGKQRTHLNRNLIRDFFASTRMLVKCADDGGEVHVTLKDRRPYSDWNIRAMARESGLVMVRSLLFDPSMFPGYCHSTTDPKAKEFDAGGAKTHVFCRGRNALDDNVDASGVSPTIVAPTEMGTNNINNNINIKLNSEDGEGQATPKSTVVVKKSSARGDGAGPDGRAAQNSAVINPTEGRGNEEEEDSDFDGDLMKALCQDDEEDGWGGEISSGEKEKGGGESGGISISTSSGGDRDGLTERVVLGVTRDSLSRRAGVSGGKKVRKVVRVGNDSQRHRNMLALTPEATSIHRKDISKSTSKRRAEGGSLRDRNGKEARTDVSKGSGRVLASASAEKKQEHTETGAGVGEDAPVLEGPIVFRKRKAAKRRELRKKAAAAKKATAVAAEGFSSARTPAEESVAEGSAEKSGSKRKRGKYIRFGKKR